MGDWRMRVRGVLGERRPAWRDAALWALPAIVFGLVLRVIFTLVEPYGYWGADSDSYFSFVYRLLSEGVASIPEKRRYVYPLVLLPTGLLPGSALRWLVFLQHLMGLLTLIPLAYVVRKVFRQWRWWVVPVTVVYAGIPIVLWYEHELLGEAFFFATMVWAFAAWVGWVGRLERGDRAEWVWWVFLAAFALCVLTKPAGRFFWPGVVIGLIYLRAWRWVRWWQWVGFAALLVASWTMGQGEQASRLLYTSAFPLTQLESPKHAELKAELAPLVRTTRARLDYFYLEDDPPKELLRKGFTEEEYPLWTELMDDSEEEAFDVMRDLALEGILAEPHLFFYIAMQRTVGAMNWTVFKLRRFEPGFFADRFEGHYEEMQEKKAAAARELFGLPKDEPLPPWSEIDGRLRSGENATLRGWLVDYVTWATSLGVFVREPVEDGKRRTLGEMWPTFLGWWMLVGIVCMLAVPRFRETLGVWALIGGGYAVGVHLVGSSNPRFFAPAWPVLIVAMAAACDVVAGWVRTRWRK